MFPIGQKVPKDREFFLVRNANTSRIVRSKGHLFDSLKIDIGRDRIDHRHHVLAGNRAAFAPLHPDTDDRYSHSKRERFSNTLGFFRTSSRFTALLPSCSHATASTLAQRLDPS